MALTPFTQLFRPLTNITPFTFTGYTFLEMYMELRDYLTETLNTELNDKLKFIYDETQRLVNELSADIDATKTQWQELFDLFMDNVIEELEGLNDQAVANLVLDTTSNIRQALDTIYPNRLEVSESLKAVREEFAEGLSDSVTRSVTTHRVSKTDTLAEHYAVRLNAGAGVPYSIFKATGNDSMSITPPRNTLTAYHNRTRASVIVNASGYRTGGWWVDQYIGLQIKNGVIIKGWDSEPGEDRGRESAVIMKDGSFKIYDETTTPQQVVADGGWNSFSWGAAAVKNGVVTNYATIPRYDVLSGRTLIGDTLDGDFIIIVFPGVSDQWGATSKDITAVARDYRFKNLYILDGGGSAQVMVEGEYLVRSSDGASRPVPDALYFYAPVTNATVRGWDTYPTINSTGTIRAKLINGVTVEIAVNLTGADVSEGDAGFLDGLTQVAAAGTIPVDMRPDANRRGALSTSSNFEATLLVSSDGSIYVIQRTGSIRSSVSGSIFYSV